MNLALYERDIDAAARVLASWKKEELVGGAGKVVPVSYWQGIIARTSGDMTKATEAFTRAHAAIAAQLAQQPDDPMLLATLGLLDAGLARKEEALREGRRAVELRPLAEDAVDGATVLSSLAMIYAWVGDVNSALDQLQFLARIPNGPPFGQLKYDPAWDAVRANPRFTAMLNQLQPRPKEIR
jgi:tetratricopeptide (TPR) repeat protein